MEQLLFMSPRIIKTYIKERLEPSPKVPNKVISGKINAGAVLVPFFCKKKQLHIIMIKRSDKLTRNPGDMAFPGGSFEKTDNSWVDTALREAKEEIGILPQQIEVLGSLGEFPVASGKYRVISIIAWLKSVNTLRPLTAETDFISAIPFRTFLDPSKYFTIYFHWGNIRQDYVRFFDTRKYTRNNIVWGMSAGIIRRFIDIMIPNHKLPAEDWVFITEQKQMLID